MRRWFSLCTSSPEASIDDLAHEVFLRLLRYDDDALIDDPQGFLFRIAANVTDEWRERLSPGQAQERAWLKELQPAYEPTPERVRREVHEFIRAAVARLAPRQREMLLMHVVDGLTYEQIARQLGFSRRLVLRELSGAYGQLRMQLDIDALSRFHQ